MPAGRCAFDGLHCLLRSPFLATLRKLPLKIFTAADGLAHNSINRIVRDSRGLLPRIEGELPEVMLVDIGLPGMSGIEGTRRIKDRHPGLAVLGANRLRR